MRCSGCGGPRWTRLAALAAAAGQLGALSQAPWWLLCDTGLDGLLPAEFFEKFAMFQSFYGRDSITRAREFFYTVYLPKLVPNLDAALEACPAPVLELMMNSVLALDADTSLDEARNLYQEIMALSERFQGDVAVQRLVETWAEDAAHTYPLLLGMTRTACHGTSLKIFVYDVPAGLTSPVLRCALGQWGTEAPHASRCSSTASSSARTAAQRIRVRRTSFLYQCTTRAWAC